MTFANLTVLLGTTVISGVITLFIGAFTTRGRADMNHWWNGTGVPIFLILWVVFVVLALVAGWIEQRPD